MANIIKQFSKQIIPFAYKLADKEQFVNQVTSSGQRIWIEKTFKTNHLFEHINQKQNANSEQCIVRALTLNDAARANYDLVGANSTILLSVRGKQSNKQLSIKLKSVSLYLFETNVAFLEYDWEYAEEKTNDYLNANYFLAELKSKENLLRVKTGKDEYREFTLESVVMPIFKTFDAVYGFDRRDGISFYDLKPILFSAVVLDQKDEDFDEILSHGAYNFKESYQTDVVKCYSPFTNSHWCGSDSAMINLSYLVDDEKTNDFFQTQFIHAARNNYFYLYLLTLNQKFTLLKRISQVSKINAKYSEINEQMLESDSTAVAKTIGKSQLYETRCNFKCPSSMNHINEFYDYARSTQKTDVFEKELQSKINSLSQIQTTYQKQLKSFKEYRQTKMLFWVFLITSFIGSITMFNSCCKIIKDLFDFTVWERLEFLSIPIILTLLFIVGIGIQVVIKYREMKRLKPNLPRKQRKDKTIK
ncbi:MAG: hypothetical protein J1F65_04340 [Clostridiales bacterium]|nr:hypothetical protein [Clostridiales bacterium]